MSKNYSINKHRLTILVGVILLLLDFGFPKTYLSGTNNAEINYLPRQTESVAKIEYKKFLFERKEAMWNATVDKVAEETLIGDRVFAERVANALESYSSEFDMDPWLIASLIRVESGGNPDAVSRVGAIGLTQIMPRTGLQIAKELNIKNYTRKMLFHPETNIRMGTFYLRKLINRFEGNLHAALAAYNWGPTHISERLEREESLPIQYPSKVLKMEPDKAQLALANDNYGY